MDKDIKEKIEHGRQILDMLERLAKGGVDLSGCEDKKCGNCGGKHPTMDDIMTKLKDRKEDKPTITNHEEARKIKKMLDTVLFREGGVAFIASKTGDGHYTNAVQIIRNLEVPDLLTNAIIFLRRAYEASVERLGVSYESKLEERIRKAVDAIFED